MTEAFIVVSTAQEAVDRLAALHERATTALSQALKRYLKDRVEPSAQERALFRYPELRLTYRINGEVPTTTRAYAKVQLPGTYSVTVTHPSSFRNYLLDADLLGLHVNVFIHVSLEKQNELALQQFESAISDRPEVMECYLMAGDPDYLIRVLVPTIQSLERFMMDFLTKVPGVANIRSSFALKQVRYKTALPLPANGINLGN